MNIINLGGNFMVDVYISPSVQHFNLGQQGYGSEEARTVSYTHLDVYKRQL